MSAKEAPLMRRIMMKLTESPAVRVFRNNVGSGFQGRTVHEGTGEVVLTGARRIKFGLCEGSSDLIGWTTLTVTPEMVGRRVAVFTALEVKRDKKQKPTPEQVNFLRAVRQAGGIAEVVTDPECAAYETTAAAWLEAQQ